MAVNRLELTWWCEPNYLPGFTRVRAEVYLEDGELLSGSNLIPNSSKRFILGMSVVEMDGVLERHVIIRADT